MKKHLPVILALSIIAVIASCQKKQGPQGPAGPSGPSFKGVINGYVSLYDQYGSRTYLNLASVQVTLKNGAAKNADANGYFYFDSVITGNYSITATGTGLATTTINNIGFVKDTFFQAVKLSAKPNFNISTFDAYHNTGSEFDSLVINVPSDTRARNIIVFVHNKASVSNTPGNYLLTIVKPVPAVAGGWPILSKVVVRIHASELNNANIFYGEQVYFAAYSYVINDMSVYTDPGTGKEVYNALGVALIDSAMAP